MWPESKQTEMSEMESFGRRKPLKLSQSSCKEIKGKFKRRESDSARQDGLQHVAPQASTWKEYTAAFCTVEFHVVEFQNELEIPGGWQGCDKGIICI